MSLFQDILFKQVFEPVVFLDFETTGLDYYKDEIIEVAAVKINENGDRDVFTNLYNTNRQLKDKIVKMTGISANDIKDKVYFNDNIKEFMSFIDNHTIIAHNASFDVSFLAKMIVDNNITYNDVEVICTFKISEEIGEKNKSLSSLCNKYKTGSFDAHRALLDVMALERLWFKEYCKYRYKTKSSKLSDFVCEMNKMKKRFPKVFKC